MKLKFTRWLRGMLILLSLIVLMSVILVLNSLQEYEPNLIELQHENIRNTLYIGIFIYFVLAVTAYFYVPLHFRRSLITLKTIVHDIQQGVYDNEIDLNEMKEFLDPAVYEVLMQINEMKETINTFDHLKKEKIFEHYSRIKAILRIMQEGAIILDLQGKIIFNNDNLLEAFPQLVEGDNLLEKSYPAEIENNIKKMAQTSLQERKRVEQVQCFIPNLKRHITLDSVLVRNEGGDVIGMVIIISNLEKKKIERKPEKGSEIT
ncbi:MAG: cell wall metabolism sensor histidine kinase WalK [Candidatus Cloacimonetes bacterium]|nr:cell wall metabolism sensor histidine kinase WalK [Candidatus Cloacimonadota bacterium]